MYIVGIDIGKNHHDFLFVRTVWLCFRQRENGKVEEVFRRQEASSFLTGIRMEPVTM